MVLLDFLNLFVILCNCDILQPKKLCKGSFNKMYVTICTDEHTSAKRQV